MEPTPSSESFFRFLNFPDVIPSPTFQFGAPLPSRAFSVDSPSDGILMDDNNIHAKLVEETGYESRQSSERETIGPLLMLNVPVT